MPTAAQAASKLTDFTVVLAAIGVGVLGVGLIVVRDLRASNRQAREMYAGSMAGLDLLSELQYQAQEARRRMLYALSTKDPNRQVEYADQSRAADAQVTLMIARHARDARTPAMQRATARFNDDWTAYLAIRDRVIAAILEGSEQQAIDLDLHDGMPAYNFVRDDLRAIKELYQQQARQQLAGLEAASSRSVIRLIVILALTQLFAILAVRRVHEIKVLRAARDSEVRLRAIIDSISEGMLVVDRGGLISLWNPAVARSFGRHAPDVVGRPLAAVLGEDDFPELLAAVERAIQSGAGAFLPGLQVVEGQMGERWFEARVFPVERGATVFVSDVTERKRSRLETARAARAADAANRSKSELWPT